MTLKERAIEMQKEVDPLGTSRKKNKYDIYNDRYWTCDKCKHYAHDMYLIELKDGRELCPDCYLEEFNT